MDLRQLKYFVAVFEHGNLSRAAEDIPISQPALTRSVKMLEDELGVELFHRHARGAAPTPAGERFYHHAKSILAECVRAREDAVEAEERLSGGVTIGVGPLFATHVIDDIVSRFCERHSLVTVTAIQGFFEELVTMLDLGQIEVAFCNFPVQELPDSLSFERLFEVRTQVFVASDHPLARMSPPSKEAMADARWATVNQQHSLNVLDALFVSDNLPAPHIALRTNSLTLIKSVIVHADFVGLVPEHMMVKELEAGTVVRLDVPSMPIVRDAGLIMRRDGYHRPIVEMLADDIRDTCREVYG
jgi:LysR family transcriptional regulator of gallate degradation